MNLYLLFHILNILLNAFLGKVLENQSLLKNKKITNVICIKHNLHNYFKYQLHLFSI